MPPPVSEDEASNVDVDELTEAPAKKSSKRKSTNKVEEEDHVEDEELLVVESKDEEDEEEEEEEVLDEDEFIVEAIKNHLIDENKEIRFHVKWKGYEKRSDMTWEPEENLIGSADDVLNEYYASVGGRDFILNGGKKSVASKKRGRPSAGTSTPTSTNGKKRFKSEPHPASATPPASLKNTEFKPPTGSWEEDVQGIDACEGTDGNVMVFLQWADGHKTQHPLEQVYKRCPQKMLKFYESHLVFKKGAGTPKENGMSEE